MDYLWTWTRTLMRTTKVGTYQVIFLAKAAAYIQTFEDTAQNCGRGGDRGNSSADVRNNSIALRKVAW